MTVVGSQTVQEASKDTKPTAPQNIFDNVTDSSNIAGTPVIEEATQAAALPGVDIARKVAPKTPTEDAYTKEELEITSQEKIAFLNAMLSGERYHQEFKLFGGRVVLKIRNRSTAETHALYSYIRHQVSVSPESITAIEGDIAYVPLVAQVAELNGTAYPEMKPPYTFEVHEGKETPPGWYSDFTAWKNKPEGLTSAILSCIQLFEYKYWSMVREANNKNFWNTDTSSNG